MSKAPVILFCYNRAAHTERTLKALAANEGAKETVLHVFCDGPKPNASDADREKIAAVRTVVEAASGFREVKVHAADTNRGLAASVINGVTEVINAHGHAIVVEDDLVTGTYFLAFMNEALQRYAGEEKVMQVSGYMFDVQVTARTDESFFLPFATSWGWATWKRAWEQFDANATGYAQLKTDAALATKFNVDGAYPFSRMLIRQMETGEVDSWAIRWWWTIFRRNGLTLFPARTLVENTGFDAAATHTHTDRFEKNELDVATRITHYPEKAIVEEVKWKQVIQYLKNRNAPPQKGLKSWLFNIFKK